MRARVIDEKYPTLKRPRLFCCDRVDRGRGLRITRSKWKKNVKKRACHARMHWPSTLQGVVRPQMPRGVPFVPLRGRCAPGDGIIFRGDGNRHRVSVSTCSLCLHARLGRLHADAPSSNGTPYVVELSRLANVLRDFQISKGSTYLFDEKVCPLFQEQCFSLCQH